MVNKYRNLSHNLNKLFLLIVLASVSTLVSSASLSPFKPSFSSIENTDVRKEVFFNYLLPAIYQKNAEIIALRKSILNNELNAFEQELVMAVKYQLQLIDPLLLQAFLDDTLLLIRLAQRHLIHYLI